MPSAQDGEVDGSAPRTRRVGSTGGWGARGISVSADDSVYEQRTANKSAPAAPTKSKQKADANTTPEEIANIFGNDSDDSDADDIPPSHIEAVGNGSEWRRDGAK